MVSPSGHAPHHTDASVVTFTRSIIVTGNTFVIVKERKRGFSACVAVSAAVRISFTGLTTVEMVGRGVSSSFIDSPIVSPFDRLSWPFLRVSLLHESDDDSPFVSSSSGLRCANATNDTKHEKAT